MRKLTLWIAEHPAFTALLCLLILFVILNWLAYCHARSMTHFVETNRRTRRTEKLRQRAESLSFGDRLRLAIKGVALERPYEAIRPDDVDLPYEAHTYRGGEGRLDAWHIPHPHSAGLVVLFHGYLGCKARLLPEARALHDLGYACFLVDFRGCGDSEGDRTSIGYHEADDVVRTMTYAREVPFKSQPIFRVRLAAGGATGSRSLRQPHSRRGDPRNPSPPVLRERGAYDAVSGTFF